MVTDAWLAASGLSGAFVDAAPDHLLGDPAAERREGFNLLRAHERAQAGRVLDGATVLISPGALTRVQIYPYLNTETPLPAHERAQAGRVLGSAPVLTSPGAP